MRHTHDWNVPGFGDGAFLEHLIEERLIAVHYDGINSWIPSDYTSKFGPSAIRYLNACNEAGSNAYIFASYRIGGNIRVVAGPPLANSKRFLTSYLANDSAPRVKMLGLDRARSREISLAEFPAPFLLPPKQQVFVEWKQCKVLAENFVLGARPNPLDPACYLPGALEVACEEYLRLTGALKRNLLRVGGTLKGFDIVGIGPKNALITAQVKQRATKRQIRAFNNLIESSGIENGHHYFFSSKESIENYQYCSINLIDTSSVLALLAESRDYGRNYLERLATCEFSDL